MPGPGNSSQGLWAGRNRRRQSGSRRAVDTAWEVSGGQPTYFGRTQEGRPIPPKVLRTEGDGNT